MRSRKQPCMERRDQLQLKISSLLLKGDDHINQIIYQIGLKNAAIRKRTGGRRLYERHTLVLRNMPCFGVFEFEAFAFLHESSWVALHKYYLLAFQVYAIMIKLVHHKSSCHLLLVLEEGKFLWRSRRCPRREEIDTVKYNAST